MNPSKAPGFHASMAGVFLAISTAFPQYAAFVNIAVAVFGALAWYLPPPPYAGDERRNAPRGGPENSGESKGTIAQAATITTEKPKT